MRGGFYDLNIFVDRTAYNIQAVKQLLTMAYEIGYDTVAINTVLVDGALAGKNSNQVVIPPPLNISADDIVAVSPRSKFKVLHRLTVIISDPAQTHKMATCEEFKKYDILAASPINEESFVVCCTTLDIDIINMPTSMLHFHKVRSQIDMAINRGVFFEICYAPAIKLDSSRRNILRTATEFFLVCKKNVILSSFATVPLDIRGPYDVANLCLLFGLDPAEGIHTVSSNGYKVLLKAECRKSLKGGFKVLPGSELPKDVTEKVENCTSAENPTSIEIPSELSKDETKNKQSSTSTKNPKLFGKGVSPKLPVKRQRKRGLRKSQEAQQSLTRPPKKKKAKKESLKLPLTTGPSKVMKLVDQVKKLKRAKRKRVV